MNHAPKTVDLHVGARIRLRRKQIGMTMQDLAAHLGITFQQVQKYERGANRVSASTLHAVAASLGSPIGWFFEGLAETANPESPMEHAFYGLLNVPQGDELARLFPELDPEARTAVIATVRALARVIVQAHDLDAAA